jgi:hypothetical protein
MAYGQGVEYTLMELHKDTDVFTELVAVTAETIGLPQVYIEKDYWVTQALKNLAESSYSDKVVFKGGTSLSKAFRLIDRFSEDIDLALLPQGGSAHAQKSLLKCVESAVTTNLVCLKGDKRESKGSRFRKTVYHYPRCIEGADFGQASPELLIEINGFTQPEPVEQRALSTLIAEVMIGKGQQTLIEQYHLQGFTINVLSVKRTLVEKILGIIKDSYHDDPVAKLSNRIRHLYDICLILREKQYRAFIRSEHFKSLCQQCIDNETAGAFDGADYLMHPLIEAPLFTHFTQWRPSLETTYYGIFSELVYGDLPSMDEVANTLRLLQSRLK